MEHSILFVQQKSTISNRLPPSCRGAVLGRFVGPASVFKIEISLLQGQRLYSKFDFFTKGSAAILKVETSLLQGQPPYSQLRFLRYRVGCRIQS